MRLEEITATPHPCGNRIDLRWVTPKPHKYKYPKYPGVRVVRREGTHPTLDEEGADPLSAEYGVVIADGENLPCTLHENGHRVYTVKDENLKGETVYYYTLFPYEEGDPRKYQFDRHNRTAAMATAPYDMAGQMYDLLPGIYHRYDTLLPKPEEVSEEDQQKGQLRRFLDLPGGQLDQLYSLARAMLDLHDIDRVDGRLLPLLAQWIGWQTDYRREVDTQRNEVRSAPHVYQTIGIIPTVEAIIKRLIGWESRTKEFVHNVCLSNRPERLNLWLRQRDSSGQWSEPTQPLSLDFAYEGRPAAAVDGDGTLWLFYHTRQGRWDDEHKRWEDQWDIWYKKLPAFSVGSDSGDTREMFRKDLDKGLISTDLQQAFADAGFSLSQNATVEKKNSEWRITDADDEEVYTVRLAEDQLNVYTIWTPSQPLTNRGCLDKHPTAVIRGETLWVFWDSYDEADRTWRIEYRYQTRQVGDDWPDGWTDMATFGEPGQPERRRPWAVVDNEGGLWLFWLEKVGARWQLKYNRHDGPDWDEESIRLFFSSAKSFPLDDNGKSVQSDVFAFADPDSRLRLFWARKVKAPNDESDQTEATVGKPNQTRWQIAYRFTAGIDDWSPIRTLPKEPADIDDWSPIRTLPKEPADYDCREPAVIWNETEETIELFWSSNRDGSWSIWHGTLDKTTHECGTAERITGNPYSQRDPLPVSLPAGTLLVYRSNESLTYTSQVYGATETLDARYAGCTTVDTRNLAKMALHRQFEDFQTYTYGAGQNGKRTGQDWYARDTVGIYLSPATENQALILRNRNLVQNVLRRFLPIQVRAVFIIEPFIYEEEWVYTYDLPEPEVEPQRLIVEGFFDSMESITSEVYSGLGEEYWDSVCGWVWVRAWSEAYDDHRTVSIDPEKEEAAAEYTKFRTWHIGLKQEDNLWKK